MAPQPLAHLLGQGAHFGLADVGDPDARRIEPIACPHAGGHAQAAFHALPHQGRLAAQGIDGIHDVIAILGDQLVDVRGVEENRQDFHLAQGVDVADARAHQLDLGLADGRQQCRQLAVDIAGRHHVVVEQREAPHPGARQRLGAIGAHAAQAGDEHVLARQGRDAGVAEQDAGALELRRYGVGLVGHGVPELSCE